MSETLSETQLNEIERVITSAECTCPGTGSCWRIELTVREARALYDLARRAPLPAVDRGMDEKQAALALEGKA